MSSNQNHNIVTDPAWKAIPKNKACFIIWRIEQLEVRPVPKEEYGNFYTGDAYIVLSVKELKTAKEAHIHFWLGHGSTPDERGCAAIKTIELDDFLGGYPVQHREVQGHESAQFLQYFATGIRYMDGGAASGFNHYERKVENKLLHIKGKHHCRVREVPLQWGSMNDGDVFVVDLDQIIFVWLGRFSSRTERLKGMEVARKLRDERGGRAIVRDVEDGAEQKSLPVDELKLFDQVLPLNRKRILTAEQGGIDDQVVRQAAAQIKLYVCREEHGTLKVTERKCGPLFKSDLDSNDSFIIDNGPNGIWVWNGRDASKLERQQALRNAEGFLKKKNYPPGTPITRVSEGAESYMFKALFQKWPEPIMVPGRQFQSSRIAKTVQTKFEAATLHDNKRLAAETQMVDDGSGKVTVYRVERKLNNHGVARYELVAIVDKYYGQFFSGDCYVVVYRYMVRNKEQVLVYFWQGRKSSQDEKGASAWHAQEIDNIQYQGRAVQVRVLQGKEPPHFLAIFKGKMITLEGGCDGWAVSPTSPNGPDGADAAAAARGDYRNPLTVQRLFHVRGTGPIDTKATEGGRSAWDHNANDLDNEHFMASLAYGSCLMHVRGSDEYSTRATQVDLTAESLNTNDVFVLFSKQGIFIWAGKGSSGDEREMARSLVSRWAPQREAQVVVEGMERQDFWEAIGGRKPYANDRRLQDTSTLFEPRLFQASNASGRFVVVEIPHFTQDDLVTDDVMILDAWDNVYVWIGEGANKQEKELAQQVAIDYIRTDPSGRDHDTPIYVVKQGFEPPSFTGFFGVWDNDTWSRGRTWEQLRTELGVTNNGLTIVKATVGPVNFDDFPKYPIELLRQSAASLPDTVDASRKEMYVNDVDFRRTFGCSYGEFVQKPVWKQQQMKKAVGLF